MTYEWTTACTLRSEDGRAIQIMRIRAVTGERVNRWFIREVTRTHIKDHHFPHIRTFAQIANEARLIAARGDQV